MPPPCRPAASPCSGGSFPHSLILLLPLRWRKDAIPPGSQERSSNLRLMRAAPTAQRVTGPDQLSPPTSIPAGKRAPLPVPTAALPVLHGHIRTIFCLGMDSALLHVLQSHSQIHNQVVWQQENERALLPPPSIRDAPAQAGQCPGPVPPRVPARRQESSAGWRCLSALAPGDPGWEKALQAGSDGKVSSRSRLSPCSQSPEPCVTARSSSGPTRCLWKPWSPVLRWWQETEDSSDEFFKFILMDYVACTFDVLDIRLGEEALDLRVVFGAAGQGNTP